MFRTTLGLLAVAALFGLTACASSPPNGTDAHDQGGARLITRAEIERSQWSNTYDLVRNLRPRWVETRGVDSFENPGEVQVYVDGMRLGPVDMLKTLSTSGIYYLEWVDPITAAGRWGLDHGQGVISISYRPATDDA